MLVADWFLGISFGFLGFSGLLGRSEVSGELERTAIQDGVKGSRGRGVKGRGEEGNGVLEVWKKVQQHRSTVGRNVCA